MRVRRTAQRVWPIVLGVALAYVAAGLMRAMTGLPFSTMLATVAVALTMVVWMGAWR